MPRRRCSRRIHYTPSSSPAAVPMVSCYCGPPLMRRLWVARRRQLPRTAWRSQRTGSTLRQVCVRERDAHRTHLPSLLPPPRTHPPPHSFLLLPLSPRLFPLPSHLASFPLSLSLQVIATEPFVFISCHHHHGSQSKASGPHCGSSQCPARPPPPPSTTNRAALLSKVTTLESAVWRRLPSALMERTHA